MQTPHKSEVCMDEPFKKNVSIRKTQERCTNCYQFT